ncbi:long-chain fatty acid transporter fat1 [Monosporozyma unispora]|nr:long-chain fatty acid transporter fat1 [Kazachstania unispora]
MSFLDIPVFIISRLFTLLFRLIRIILFPFAKLITWTCGDYFVKLDKRHRITEDFYIIPTFFKYVFQYIWAVRTHRFQNWYIFIKQVKNQGDNLAIRYAKALPTKGDFELESYTYKELYAIVLRLSYILVNTYHVQPGQHIAIDCTNKPLFIFLWFSLWNIGAVPAFLNYNTMGKPLIHSLQISDIAQVFIDPEASIPISKSEEEIKNALPGLVLNYLDEKSLYETIMHPQSPEFLQEDELRTPKELTDYKPSMLIYTSGTTGLPKSAIMSWRKSSVGCKLFGHVLHMNPDSIVFTGMPLFHSTAALLGACAILSQGGCIALANKFSASQFWKQAYLTEATHVQYVGEVCRYLLHTPKSEYESMHRVKVAYGNGLRSDIWQQFRKRFNIEVIGEFYAATEAPFATTSFQRGEFGVGACRNYGTIIQWFLQYQQTLVKVQKDDDAIIYRNEMGFCEVSDVNEPGEMLMRIFFPRKPETSFQGYLGNAKETKSKVLRNVFRNGDAWYRCGDLLKADEYGLWYFLDRMGDTFRWKSENVSTTEVEDQVAASNEQEIRQVTVVGIKISKYEGRAGFAVIQLAKDVASVSAEEKMALLNKTLAYLNQSLPKYALPILVKFVNKIEMTNNHKVIKKIYREQKLPKGESGHDELFWLKNYNEYRVLTLEDWDDIEQQKVKL